MSKSVREISDQLGVNRSTVYRAIKKHNLEPEISSDGSETALYSEDSIKVIRDEIKRLRAKKDPQKRSETASQTVENNSLIDALKETIRIQSDEIEHLRNENLELREMIKREQEIRAGLLAIEARAQTERPRLTDRIKSRFKKRDRKSDETAPV